MVFRDQPERIRLSPVQLDHANGARQSAEAHRYVEVWERAGHMSGAEAAAWRERIAIWRRFRAGGQVQRPKPVVGVPLVDDPDPYLP